MLVCRKILPTYLMNDPLYSQISWKFFALPIFFHFDVQLQMNIMI